MFGIALFIPLLLWHPNKENRDAWRSPRFWVLVLCIVFVCWVNQYGLFYKMYLDTLPWQIYKFNRALAFNLHTSFFYLSIPLIFRFFYPHPAANSFYGLSTRGFHARVYILLLLAMMPLLIWASFQDSFLQAYPRYRPGSFEIYTAWPVWASVGLYELSYAFQFVALEVFFRGFIVMELSRFVGDKAVFPMVSLYLYIHFFKPPAEALGSIFGGYILGVISLRTQSVLGGMLIHIGIAWTMEILAFWQM